MLKKFATLFVLVAAMFAQNDEFSLSKTTIGGYGELHLNSVSTEGVDKTKTTADFHRFVLFFGYNFSDTWSFKSEVELEHNMVGGKGGKYKGELELEQAYVDYHGSDEFGFRAGVILAPVGYMNETHEPPTFLGVERPSFDKYILPTTWFDNGAMIYGRVADMFSYNLAIMGGLNGDALATGIRNARIKGESEELGGYNFNNPTFIARVDYIGMEGLNIGLSFTKSDARYSKGGSNPINIIDFHAKYEANNIHAKFQIATVNYNEKEDPILQFDGSRGVLIEAGYDLFSDDETALIPFGRFEHISMKSNAFGGVEVVGKTINAVDANTYLINTFGVAYKPLAQVVFKADYSTRKADFSDAKAESSINLGVGYMF